MSAGTNIEKLKDLLDGRAKRQIPNQVSWGTVSAIDWDKKQCTVVGLVDELEYYGVSLGVGNRLIKPVIGTRCLIGSILNQEADTYLIDVEEYEEKIYTSGKNELHITKDGFVIKNDKADIKSILKEAFEQLMVAKILTPSGPGNFSPDDVTKFGELKTDVLNLFK
ncbi:MAG: hypothetical protein M9958_03190 [Chitinophagales bacterium]|nr:hypothetical protein [Chitinophagales bacterium]